MEEIKNTGGGTHFHKHESAVEIRRGSGKGPQMSSVTPVDESHPWSFNQDRWAPRESTLYAGAGFSG
jgi:hypothetical protein